MVYGHVTDDVTPLDAVRQFGRLS